MYDKFPWIPLHVDWGGILDSQNRPKDRTFHWLFFFPLSFFLKKKAPYISVGSRLLLFTHKLIKSTFFLLKTKFACNRNKFNLIQFMYIVGCFWTVNGRRPFGIIKNIDCCHSLFSVFTLEQIYVSPFFLASFSKYVTLS